MLSNNIISGWLDEDGNPVQDPALRWKTTETGAATPIVAAFDPEILGESTRSDCPAIHGWKDVTDTIQIKVVLIWMTASLITKQLSRSLSINPKPRSYGH